ncbi:MULTISPECIES: hypothetical protein [unclassified Streptomyces]|uniref:hypothetical protein n=1 Tax=unclassified Streptomyces TaxID=2593676 RepID=UPI0033B7F15D
MSEWRDAEEVPLPIPVRVPAGEEVEFNRTGLWLTLSRGGRRQRTQVIQYRDLPDGTRAILTIVDWPSPSIPMVWVAWDPDRMSLEYTSREVLATAEAQPREGDAHAIGTGEMLDCFTGDHTTYWPHREVEVRVGGLWRPGRLRCIYRGPRNRAVALVMTSLYEPGWGAWVAFKRMYRWDPAAIRPVRAPDPPS